LIENGANPEALAVRSFLSLAQRNSMALCITATLQTATVSPTISCIDTTQKVIQRLRDDYPLSEDGDADV
jgi:hypothetical protein